MVFVFDGGILYLMCIAFFAGILSILSPCTIVLLPGITSVIMGSSNKSIKSSIAPFGILFITIGFVFLLIAIGSLFFQSFLVLPKELLQRGSGALMIILGILHLRNVTLSPGRGVLWGISFGILWSACTGSILASILLLAVNAGMIGGSIILGSFVAGSLLTIALFAYSFVKYGSIPRIYKSVRIFSYKIPIVPFVSGMFMILLGIVLATGLLTQFLASFGAWDQSIVDFFMSI